MGGIILFWLPIEDLNLIGVVILAAVVCFWLAILLAVRNKIASRFYAWVGLLAGVLVGPTAFFLWFLR